MWLCQFNLSSCFSQVWAHQAHITHNWLAKAAVFCFKYQTGDNAKNASWIKDVSSWFAASPAGGGLLVGLVLKGFPPSFVHHLTGRHNRDSGPFSEKTFVMSHSGSAPRCIPLWLISSHLILSMTDLGLNEAHVSFRSVSSSGLPLTDQVQSLPPFYPVLSYLTWQEEVIFFLSPSPSLSRNAIGKW